MAAAVADYRPAERRDDKRPKDAERWTVELEPTTDVLRALARRRARTASCWSGSRPRRARTGIERARRKLADKRVDLVVLNDVSRNDIGFDAPDNEVVLVTADGERRVPQGVQARTWLAPSWTRWAGSGEAMDEAIGSQPAPVSTAAGALDAVVDNLARVGARAARDAAARACCASSPRGT